MMVPNIYFHWSYVIILLVHLKGTIHILENVTVLLSLVGSFISAPWGYRYLEALSQADSFIVIMLCHPGCSKNIHISCLGTEIKCVEGWIYVENLFPYICGNNAGECQFFSNFIWAVPSNFKAIPQTIIFYKNVLSIEQWALSYLSFNNAKSVGIICSLAWKSFDTCHMYYMPQACLII